MFVSKILIFTGEMHFVPVYELSIQPNFGDAFLVMKEYIILFAVSYNPVVMKIKFLV